MSEPTFSVEEVRAAAAGSSRRQLLKRAGLTTAAVAAASLLRDKNQAFVEAAEVATFKPTTGKGFKANAYDILNFALNLEYLEANYYLLAYTGTGLSAADTGGVGAVGTVTGGAQVPFTQGSNIMNYAGEIAIDEMNHVLALRAALGARAVAMPNINFTDAFNTAASAAGLGSSFNPFASEANFLIGAFVFEDVGVTAYHGGAPYLSGDILNDAAGILGVEAYHAGAIRATIFALANSDPTTYGSLVTIANAISALRNAASNAVASGPQDTDQAVTQPDGTANIVPADVNSIAFARTFQQVLNIVYLNASPTLAVGGFFPTGLNGRIA